MSRATVAATRKIAASPEAVWRLIATPGHLEECHPFVAANPVTRWPGVGSQDEVHYHNGRVITRRFTAWDDHAGYDIDVVDANGAVAGVTWRLVPAGTGSALTIAITPRMRGLPPPLRWALVRPMLRRYLRAVLRGVEWRATTGRPVRRNQFGSHRWFSPGRAQRPATLDYP